MLPSVLAPSSDYREAKGVIANYVEALTKVVSLRVVALSSMGAHRTSGVGNVTALSLLEQGFRSLPPAYDALCAAQDRRAVRYAVPAPSARRWIMRRTAIVNQIRALLLERGITVRAGKCHLDAALPNILEDGSTSLSGALRFLLAKVKQELEQLAGHIEQAETPIQRAAQRSGACQRLDAIPGIGQLTATSLIAAIGNGGAFRKGREFAAWLGLVPREHSTGGMQKLLPISGVADLVIIADRPGIRHQIFGPPNIPRNTGNQTCWPDSEADHGSPNTDMRNDIPAAQRAVVTGQRRGFPAVRCRNF